NVHFVCLVQPRHYLSVDVFQLLDGDAMSDAVFLYKAARINEPAGGGRVLEGEAQIDARARGGLDLGYHVTAVQRHDGLARAGLDVLGQPEAALENLIIE